MELEGLIARLGEDAVRVADEFKKSGFVVYLLPAGMVGTAEFFEAIKALLPLDPPLIGSRSWDALSDSLWAGLDGLSADKIAIVWPTARGLREFDIARGVLTDVSHLLANPDATHATGKTLAIVVT